MRSHGHIFLLLWFMTLAAAVRPAAAERLTTAVLGPSSTSASAKDVTRARRSLARALRRVENVELAPAGDADPACVVEAACLLERTGAIGADRAVGVHLEVVGRQVELQMLLVDRATGGAIAVRRAEVFKERLGRAAGRTLVRLLDRAPARKELARRHFVTGSDHFDQGAYHVALAEFEKAYLLEPLPGFLYNLAQCHRKLGHFVEAISLYESYLERAAEPRNRDVVRDLIAECKKLLAEQEREARQQPARQEESRKRSAASEAAQRETAQREAAHKAPAPEAQPSRQSREPVPEARPPVAAPPPSRTRLPLAPARERHPARPFAYAGLGAGALTLAVGGFFALEADAAQSAFENAGCGDPSRPLTEAELAQCRRDEDRGAKRSRLANVLFGSGAALLATSLALFLIDPGESEPEPARARIDVGPSSVLVTLPW